MGRDPLYRIEQTAYAIGLAFLGFYYAGVVIKDWVSGAIDKATTWGVTE